MKQPLCSVIAASGIRYLTGAGVCLLSLGMTACAHLAQQPPTAPQGFFSAWAAPQGRIAEQAPDLENSTVRVVVRPTIGGTALRIKLENTIARTPVTFAAVYVGELSQEASLVGGTNKALTFNGQSRVTLAPGAGIYSDAVDFSVRAFQRLAVSMDVVTAEEISTHAVGLASNYYASGHHAQSESGEGFTLLPTRAQNVVSFPVYWVAAVDVKSNATSGTIVALGDSITDGRCSTTDDQGNVVPDLDRRWPDVLAERLASMPASYPKAVVNAGIAGNRILQEAPTGPPALARFERDVLDRAGITHIILFEGTNDIHRGATAAELIEGTRQLIDRAHARGVKIIGATMIPRGQPAGSKRAGFDEIKERYRLQVNDWIRNQADFDGVIDFEAVMLGGGASADGAQIMKPEYSCDFVHPNAAGYRALGESIDLDLFR